MSRVALVCDIGPSLGSGHAMRCLALAEELLSRGCQVTYVADVGSIPWVRERIASSGADITDDLDDLAQIADRLAAHAIVVDSYRLGPHGFAAIRSNDRPVLAMVDHELRGAVADLYIDQNIGSERDVVAVPTGATRLAGLDYALMRNEILEHRPAEPPTTRRLDVPRVFGVFGGTDPVGAGPMVARALVATGVPFQATLVTGRPDLRAEIGSLQVGVGQSVATVHPTSLFAQTARDSDLVVSAAGTSTWELLCLGAPTALVCVADNQEAGYRRAVDQHVAVGIGDARRDMVDTAVEPLAELLTEAERRREVAVAGWRAVDGRGRVRVADALLDLIG